VPLKKWILPLAFEEFSLELKSLTVETQEQERIFMNYCPSGTPEILSQISRSVGWVDKGKPNISVQTISPLQNELINTILFHFAKLYLMNGKIMNTISRTNWEKVGSLTEAEIDTSDISRLTEEFFTKSRWWKPVASLNALVQIAPKTLAWFQSQGDDYEKKMAAALRIYAEAHSA
jgi:uncharacterized protein (DUF4415 family)